MRFLSGSIADIPAISFLVQLLNFEITGSFKDNTEIADVLCQFPPMVTPYKTVAQDQNWDSDAETVKIQNFPIIIRIPLVVLLNPYPPPSPP